MSLSDLYTYSEEPMIFDSTGTDLRCDLCGSAGTLEVVDIGNGVCCFPMCLGEPEEWYAEQVALMAERAPA